MGEKKHIHKVPPQKSRDNPVKILFTCFLLYVCFCAPNLHSEGNQTGPDGGVFKAFVRRESSGGVEWLGVWNCIFSGSEFSNF